MTRKRDCIKNGSNCHSKPLLDGFSNPSIYPLRRLGFMLLHCHAKKNFEKKRTLFAHQGSNTPPSNCQVNAQPINQFMFHYNSYTYRIILPLIMTNHIIKTINN